METNVYSNIETVIASLQVDTITEDRKLILQPLIDFIKDKVTQEKEIRINFICTHNSRRSHLTQIWAQTMAVYFNLQTVKTYSGGTEATAMFPKVAETLINMGFKIDKIATQENPIYSIKFNDNSHPIIGFSKKYDDDFNPKTAYAAVMTCSQADKGCPFVAGTEKRITITYEDPKLFDGKENQSEKYTERSLQIATEMFYVFSKVKN
jgi:arsenate reductase